MLISILASTITGSQQTPYVVISYVVTLGGIALYAASVICAAGGLVAGSATAAGVGVAGYAGGTAAANALDNITHGREWHDDLPRGLNLADATFSAVAGFASAGIAPLLPAGGGIATRLGRLAGTAIVNGGISAGAAAGSQGLKVAAGTGQWDPLSIGVQAGFGATGSVLIRGVEADQGLAQFARGLGANGLWATLASGVDWGLHQP